MEFDGGYGDGVLKAFYHGAVRCKHDRRVTLDPACFDKSGILVGTFFSSVC
jgi:hypothetical protein